MSQSGFRFSNSPNTPIPSEDALKSGFSISAALGTDIWAKPPNTFRINAPVLHQTVPLASFRRARVHVRAEWEVLYDQGGLVIVLQENGATVAAADAGSGGGDSKYRRWVKTGIEFVNGAAHVSTVAKDAWADWSLLAVPSSSSPASTGEGGDAGVTVEMVKEKDRSLWVYLVDSKGTKSPIREITWVFEEETDMECWIGVFAARPSQEAGKELAVHFQGLEIETTS